MQYVRSLTGTVSKGWNSINPATLSGAIDVIVVEQEDGSLACSPFHVRFGKFQLLRPSDKKVQFTVNDVKQDYSMKLGEGGEAFFVFETSAAIPEEMQTSPLTSPAASPEQRPLEGPASDNLPDPEPLELDGSMDRRRGRLSMSVPPSDMMPSNFGHSRPMSGDWSGYQIPRSNTDDLVPTTKSTLVDLDSKESGPLSVSKEQATAWNSSSRRSASPPPLSPEEAMARAVKLSKQLLVSNIPNKVTERGDLMLDMTGYKSSEEEALRAEVFARKLLADELEGNYDIGTLIGADEHGNLWIYSSEEAKAEASRKLGFSLLGDEGLRSTDAISDPGYHSDDAQSDTTAGYSPHMRRDSDSAVGLLSPPQSPDATTGGTKSYAKTLRLTSEQLKALDLRPGSNTMSFTVNRSTCQAYMFYWKHDTPIVISDIDGTITKSDALGHVLNMIGRDWTHLGVAKLYTDIVNNGYNIFYLTSRSVGQADTTRAYLNGVVQDEGYRLPKGPVIMSPDRTMAALRREIYLRKPEVFKMACLRDIMNLFNKPAGQTPFYAGFGNRLTDALSYRSVNIPSTRIFTINSNAEVSLDVLSLNSYKTGYASMREIVDHFFPPVGLLVPAGGEQFTDFSYWREKPMDLEDFTDSEEDEEDDDITEAASLRSEDEGSEIGEDLEASYMTNESVEDAGLEDSILESVEGDDYAEDEEEEYLEGQDENGLEEYDASDAEDEELEEETGTPTDEVKPGVEGLTEEVDSLSLRDATPTPQASPQKGRKSPPPIASSPRRVGK
ncbi:LNS2-domain-containing protein [Aaosphaeria arxii CBS 175.79]|uniref:LNS2-domain-containing protein n=1 Tax=Aaosphaeria arxii CBS 175.79 TaxID=1450172 RepID=A0A6A5XWF7_9PLEO|nr:LNS2-domain-containing protein [Aaosphaeria arxii CBS 175.79]KAF2017658.1 LNS2-domain-containing protein [Aaosphaeria arxii CBS 175.79]